MSTRQALLRALEEAVGPRKVVWFGTRGIDALPLLALPQFAECFAITVPLGIPGIKGMTLETLTRQRVDLDTYDIDLDPSTELLDLRRHLLASLAEPSIVVAYRPSRFLSSIHFARLATVTPAFLFQEQQAAFEHKPWVETQLRRRGVTTIPWDYVADEQHAQLARRIHEGPLILRPSKGSGGVGLVRVDDEGEIQRSWPQQAEAFVSVAPYLQPVVPLNVAGCVGALGEVVLHPPSLQLIGIPSCTDRTFGYCGNDYGAAKALDPEVVRSVEALASEVGRWLQERGYVGAFGVDLLLSDGAVLFTEVNARFQGCSLLGSEVDRQLDLPDVHLEHLASHIGVELPPRPPLTEQVEALRALAHVVVHNMAGSTVTRSGPTSPDLWPPDLLDITSTVEPGVGIAPGAALCRMVFGGVVTSDGFALPEDVDKATNDIHHHFNTGVGDSCTAGERV